MAYPVYFAFPRDPNVPAMSFMASGLGFTFLLMFMRMRFIWWPLHPAGYPISMTYGVGYFWSCLVISTFLKWMALRFGGPTTYRRMIFFFFGVILGEYCVGAFWSVLSVIIREPIYDFAPG